MSENQKAKSTPTPMRKLRMRSGKTQTQVASELHVAQPTVADWEKGKSLPHLTLLASICAAINCSLDELIEALTETWTLYRSREDGDGEGIGAA